MRTKSLKFMFAPALFGAIMFMTTTVSVCQDSGAKVSRTRRSEPNLRAPDVYADSLKIKITLVNLPGADDPRSSWEGSYQLFFVSEAEFQNIIKTLPSGGSSPRPEQFPNRISLSKGTFKRDGLANLKDRTYSLSEIPFKARIADKDLTKEGRIMTSYSVKINDAKLQSRVYRSGIFITHPFDDSGGPEKTTARRTVYLNFFVTQDGNLFYSQWPRETESTTW